MTFPTFRLIAIGAVAALGLTACGGDDDTGDDTQVEATGDEAIGDAVDDVGDAADDVLDDGAELSAADAEDAVDEAADVADEAADEVGTIIDVAGEAGSFGTLVAVLQATGLDETLAGDGPFTVFAPSDQAFVDSLTELDVSIEDLLTDPDTLSSILTYHVIEGELPAEMVLTLDGQTVETVNGAELEITVDGDTVMVNDATLVTTDIEASNGVIHVIDKVLMPPTN